MSSAQIKSLMQPPAYAESHSKAKATINSHFRSIDDLGDLEKLAQESQQRHEELARTVRTYHHTLSFCNSQRNLVAQLSTSEAHVDEVLKETRQTVETHLNVAQELSLLRHSLNDELTDLTKDLASLEYNEDREPLLLEDLDTLHRNLRELLSVKQYVQVIQRALQLRYVMVTSLQGGFTRNPFIQ